MRRIAKIIAIASFGTALVAIIFSTAFGITRVHAQCSATNSGQYCLLEPLPNGTAPFPEYDAASSTTGTSAYINLIIKVFISIIGVLGVVMIVVGGLQYMMTDIVSEKSAGRERITNAVFGLLLALASWLILYTINPNLTNINLQPPQGVAVTVSASDTPPMSDTSILPAGQTTVPSGVYCPGSGGAAVVSQIVQSYAGKVTYCVTNGCGKGQAGPNGTVQYDCSGFVDKVLSCAGLPPTAGEDSGSAVNSNAGVPITSLTDTTVNGQPLIPGDVLGWGTPFVNGVQATDGNGNPIWGHVVIYIGNGQIGESIGPSGSVGNAIRTSEPTTHYYPWGNSGIKYTQLFQE